MKSRTVHGYYPFPHGFTPLENRGSLTGFTLVEVMIVVGIIALLAAISIPILSRVRMQADETAAIATVKALVAAEETWRAVNPNYTDIDSLITATPPYIGGFGAASGGWRPKQRYYFYVYRDPGYGLGVDNYAIVANPIATDPDPDQPYRTFCAHADGIVKAYNFASSYPTNCTGTPVGE